MREKAQRWLARECIKEPHAQDCTHYGDRIEVRRLWAHSTDPQSTGLYAASQVFAVEREVIPLSKAVKASKERCYAITSTAVLDDRERSLPEFNRACAINGIDTAITWLTRKYNPLGR